MTTCEQPAAISSGARPLPDRRGTLAALRWGLRPHDAAAAALLDQCADEWPADHGALWYPQAGDDHRDLLELGAVRRALHDLPIQPHLFIHTGLGMCGPCMCARRSTLLHDSYTQMSTVALGAFAFAGAADVDGRTNTAWLRKVEVRSGVCGRYAVWLLSVEQRELDFFCQFVARGGLRFSTLIQVRHSLWRPRPPWPQEIIAPWIAWAGLRQMITDGQTRGPHHPRDGAAQALIDAGAPIYTPGASVQHREPAFLWHKVPVTAATVEPSPVLAHHQHSLRSAKALFRPPDHIQRALSEIDPWKIRAAARWRSEPQPDERQPGP